MVSDTRSTDNARAIALAAQVGALQQKLDQRENALAMLNRRLLQLERTENSAVGVERAAGLAATSDSGLLDSDAFAQIRRLEADNEHLREEIQRIRDTKLFRWAAPARRVYALTRGAR
jgi:hypothetical protein